MSTTGRRLSEHECEQRRAKDRERMRRAAEQLLGSEGCRRGVRVRAAYLGAAVLQLDVVAFLCRRHVFAAGVGRFGS
jgi:hypothetical protein